MKYKVTLKPEGKVVEIDEGQNLLSALREQEVYIKSSCGGVASCSDCIIKIVSGEDHLSPPPFSELKLLGNVFHITKERLACQTTISGDVSIDISRHDKDKDENRLKHKTSSFSQKKQIKIRKETEVQQSIEEKNAQKNQKDQSKKETTDQWHKHWEKEATEKKQLAGGKRPKFFDTDKIDYEKKDFTRPLPEEKKKKTEFNSPNNDQGESSVAETKKEFKKFRD